MPWSKTGATQYHAQLGLPDKGCASPNFVVCNSLGSRDVVPAKRSGSRLL